MKRGLKKFLSSLMATTMLLSGMSVASFNPLLVSAASTISVNAKGWYETAYAEWLPVTGAASYDVYVKSSSSSYTKLDSELVRKYDTFWRADAVGLKAGNYYLKIVAKDSSGNELATQETGSVTVDSYDRAGFGFSDGTSSSGGYNDDGTPKSNAVIYYITSAADADALTMDVVTNGKGTKTSCTGMDAIMKAREKGYDTTPLIFRFIGQVTKPTWASQKLNQIDIKKTSNITFEGIGNDAMTKFDFNIVASSNIEVRNLGFKDMTTSDEDGVTIKDAAKNIWVHNCDFFYGGKGSDADQVKGDGSVDLKGTSTKITISDNHYWDCGKVNLCGLSETADYEITYSKNWFDHSDSRHPRVRTGSIHVYNNYYDGNAKYGVGATSGSSIFVQGNYFRNCAKPVLSSLQGTDAQGAGTFSKESGGIIKMFDNIMVGSKYTYIEGITGTGSDKTYNNDADGYTVESADEQLPSSLVTVSGGTSYNNFDTTRDLGLSGSKIGVMSASEVPSYVTTHAGRIDGGNFKFIFDDSTEDTNYSVITELQNALTGYTMGANTSYVSSKSATGIDGNTFYTDRAAALSSKVSTLASETDPSGNTVTGGGSSNNTISGTTSSALVLNGKSDISADTYSTNVENVGTDGAFAVLATSGKTVTVSTSKGIQLGGAGSTTYRAIRVTTADGGVITVTSASSGTEERTLNVTDASGNVLGTIQTGSSSGVAIPSAGTYYIYSTSGGINVSKVSVAYNSTEESTESTTSSATTTTKADATTTTKTETTTTTTTKEQATETTTATIIGDDVTGAVGDYYHNFSEDGLSSSFYSFTSPSITSSKGEVTYNDMPLTDAMKLNSSAVISFTSKASGELTLVFNSSNSGNTVYVDSTSYKIPSNGLLTVSDLAAGSHTVKKNSGESYLYYIAYTNSTEVTAVKGDANGDGKLDGDDVRHILNYVLGKIDAVNDPSAADVTGDGKVTSADANKIAKAILGSITL